MDHISQFEDSKESFEKITETTAYSNATELTKMTSLLEICQYINECKKKTHRYRPLAYALRPIEWLFPDATKPCPSYTPLNKSDSDKLEQHLIALSNIVKTLKYSLDHDVAPLHIEHLQEKVDAVKTQWQIIKKTYEDEIKRLRNLILDVQIHKEKVLDIDQALRKEEQFTLRDAVKQNKRDVRTFRRKRYIYY